MKKITLSVVALTMTMMSFGQTQCKSLTADSVNCKNNTKAKNSLCYLHNPYYKDQVKTPAKSCTGTTKSGNNCKNKTKDVSVLCHNHRKD